MRKNLAYCVMLLIALALFSCRENDDKLLLLRVNHYQVPSQGAFSPSLNYQVQTGNAQSGEWKTFGPIENFPFESGFIYEIIVLNERINDPPQDGSSVRNSLIRIVSKTPADPNATFDLTLNNSLPGGVSFVNKNEQGNFLLVNSILINCGNLCDALDQKLQQNISCTGKFVHGENQSITLVELN